MATSASDIRGWFQNGKTAGAAYMLVVCDTYDWEDYPIYVTPSQDLAAIATAHHGPNMQKVMECYDLSMDMERQLVGGTYVWNGWRPGR